MKKATIIAFIALLYTWVLASCTKEEVLPTTNPVNDQLALQLDQIADFKVILPKGNQVIADGEDAVQYEILFYDKDGKVINDKLPILTDIIGKVDVDGKKMYLPSAVKATKIGAYSITITAGKITKSIPIVATTADKKIVEIPIIFNFVSTDYSDKAVDLTFTNLVNTYKRNGVDNVVFKLAEIDNDGKPLLRKGVKFWNFNGVATDQMDYKKLWSNKYAFDVYLIDNKTVEGATAYAVPDHIVIDNINIKKQYENPNSDSNPSKIGMAVLIHEMGHVLGLKHVYRDDNLCQIQEGVNDIQAINFKTTTSLYIKEKQIVTFTTNCGGIIDGGNVMMGAGAKSVYDFWLSNDQIKISKKTALTLKF